MSENKTFGFAGMTVSVGDDGRTGVVVNGNELHIGHFTDEALALNITGNKDEYDNDVIDIRDSVRCAQPGDTHTLSTKQTLRGVLLGNDELETKHSWEGAIFLPEVP